MSKTCFLSCTFIGLKWSSPLYQFQKNFFFFPMSEWSSSFTFNSNIFWTLPPVAIGLPFLKSATFCGLCLFIYYFLKSYMHMGDCDQECPYLISFQLTCFSKLHKILIWSKCVSPWGNLFGRWLCGTLFDVEVGFGWIDFDK